MRRFIAFVTGWIACAFGGLSGLMLTGLGICGGGSLSLGVFTSALFIGAIVSLVGATVVSSAWWFGAALFSGTMFISLVVTIFSHEWLRGVAIVACMVGALAAAFLGRFLSTT